MMRMKKIMIVVLLQLMLSVLPAQAARNGKVVVDSAKIFENPKPGSTVIDSVPKETPVQVSNTQTNGYFRVRVPGGTVGWISGNEIFVSTPELKVEPETVAQKTAPDDDPEKEDRARIQLTGGMQLLNFTGIPAAIDVSDVKTGIGGTLEIQFKLMPMIYLAGRAEYYKKSGSIVSFSTFPLMAGLSIVPFSTKLFRLGIGAYSGAAIMTNLSIEKDGKKSEYSAFNFTGYGNIQASVALFSNTSFLLEGGYRIHTLNAPENTSADGLLLPAFEADFGGIIARAGFEFRF